MTRPFYAIVGSKEERSRFAVLQLQRYLRKLTDPALSASGVWDDRTARALEQFQLQNGLLPTGLADLETWQTVVSAGEAAISAASDPLPLVLPPSLLAGGRLSPGDRGDAVALVQIILNRFLLTLPDAEPLAADGFFGPQTAAAVRRFRALHGWEDGDTVDKAVWNLLTLFFSTPASFE